MYRTTSDRNDQLEQTTEPTESHTAKLAVIKKGGPLKRHVYEIITELFDEEKKEAVSEEFVISLTTEAREVSRKNVKSTLRHLENEHRIVKSFVNGDTCWAPGKAEYSEEICRYATEVVTAVFMELDRSEATRKEQGYTGREIQKEIDKQYNGHKLYINITRTRGVLHGLTVKGEITREKNQGPTREVWRYKLKHRPTLDTKQAMDTMPQQKELFSATENPANNKTPKKRASGIRTGLNSEMVIKALRTALLNQKPTCHDSGALESEVRYELCAVGFQMSQRRNAHPYLSHLYRKGVVRKTRSEYGYIRYNFSDNRLLDGEVLDNTMLPQTINENPQTTSTKIPAETKQENCQDGNHVPSPEEIVALIDAEAKNTKSLSHSISVIADDLRKIIGKAIMDNQITPDMATKGISLLADFDKFIAGI